jgi:hypothetical protein
MTRDPPKSGRTGPHDRLPGHVRRPVGQPGGSGRAVSQVPSAKNGLNTGIASTRGHARGPGRRERVPRSLGRTRAHARARPARGYPQAPAMNTSGAGRGVHLGRRRRPLIARTKSGVPRGSSERGWNRRPTRTVSGPSTVDCERRLREREPPGTDAQPGGRDIRPP